MHLSHRERVIKALSHEETDRIPFDLGSTICSSIHIMGYQRLKAFFGMENLAGALSKVGRTSGSGASVLRLEWFTTWRVLRKI